jgi:hypothetical protein
MKENVRMWRERIQVVVEYFDSRLHQIVQSTERRKVVECGEKEFRSSLIILTSSVTKLYRDKPCTSILLAGGKGYTLYAHAAGCGKDTPCTPILLEVEIDTPFI